MATEMATVVLGLGLLLVACGALRELDSWARLIEGNGLVNHTSLGVGNVASGQTVSIGSMPLCLSRAGRVRVTAVRPVDPVGPLRVTGFAVRPNPYWLGHESGGTMLGDKIGPLTANGFGHSHIVDVACGKGDTGAGYELGLQLWRPGRAPVAASGFRVEYESAGHRARVILPNGVVLCPREAGAPECERINPMRQR
ncbi:MAG: hypothetical protein ABI873_00175 [Marmoricola sp.]